MIDMLLLKQMFNPREALRLKVLKLKKDRFRSKEFEYYPQDILFIRILTNILASNNYYGVKKIVVKKIADIFFKRFFAGKEIPKLLQREVLKLLSSKGIFEDFNNSESVEIAIYELGEIYDLICHLIVFKKYVPEKIRQLAVKLIDNSDIIVDIILRSNDEVIKQIALDKIFDYDDYRHLIFNVQDEKICYIILDKILYQGDNSELLQEISTIHLLEGVRKKASIYLLDNKKRVEVSNCLPESFTEEMIWFLDPSKDQSLLLEVVNKNGSEKVILKAIEKMRYTEEIIRKVDLNVWVKLIGYLDKEVILQLIDLYDDVILLESISLYSYFVDAQKRAMLKLCEQESMEGVEKNKEKLPEEVRAFAEECIQSLNQLNIALSDDIQAEVAVEQVKYNKHLWKIVFQSENQNVRKIALRRIDFEMIDRSEIEMFILDDYNRALSLFALSLIPLSAHKRFVKDIVLNHRDNNLRLEAINKLDKEKDKEFLLKLIVNSDPFIINAVTAKYGDKEKVKEALRELKDISANEQDRKKKLRNSLQLLFEAHSETYARKIISDMLDNIAVSDLQEIKFEYAKYKWNEKRLEEYDMQSALNEIENFYQRRNFSIGLDRDKGIILSDKGGGYDVIYAYFRLGEGCCRFYGIKNEPAEYNL